MQSTAIHETVHHLQSVVAGHPSEADFDDKPALELLCKDEGEAFAIVDTYWRAVGQSDRQRGPDWWFAYSHCHEFYDPDWEGNQWLIHIFFDGLTTLNWFAPST